MSWLYQHRDELDGVRPLVEIAHRITFGVPPCDRDDAEQDIVITLMRVSRSNANLAYLWGAARKELAKYWYKKYYQAKKVSSFYDGIVYTPYAVVNQNDNLDAKLDAIAILATLPARLVRIGCDRLNGKKLSPADYAYWRRHKGKNAKEISDAERKRILRLHDKGLSVYTIRKTTGRCYEAIQRAIKGAAEAE